MGVADRRAREFKRREEDIIQAAFDLFAEHGIETVTIDMIAEKAEVGKGTIYKHFKGKNDIFATMIIRQGEELTQALADMDPDAPVIVQIKKMIRIFWEFQTRDMRKFEVYRKCDQLLLMDDMAPEVLLRFTQLQQMKSGFVRSLIQRAMDEQIFREGDVEDFVVAAMGLYTGIFDLILRGEAQPSEALYELLERMLFKGFMR
jgi:AcrR family transcriptional regulator